MKAIYNLDVHVDSKAPKPSSQTEETEASKSETGQLEKDTQSSLAMDKSPSHLSPPTPVVGERLKEAQQAAGGPTSLGATSVKKEPPPTCSIVDMDGGTKTYSFNHICAGSNPSANEESRADDISVKVKLEDLSKILKDIRSAFFTPESPPNEPIIVSDESKEEEEVAKYKDSEATSHDVAELKNIKWELPAEFLTLQSQVSLVQEKLKILDSLPSLWHKAKATTSPAEREKITKDADTNLKDELVDLLGKNVVTQYYTKKLLFDKYYDKILKRTKSSKIIKCKVLTKKGPITLKIYREDGSDEVISNLKTRLDQLTQTEQELKIDLNKPLKEQDPLNELNELANKKRKRTSDLKTIP
ncbi:hypothetical protein Tco_1059059, partial [Tanacetum coccineum]